MNTYLLDIKQTNGEDLMNVRADVQLKIFAPATQKINAMHEKTHWMNSPLMGTDL